MVKAFQLVGLGEDDVKAKFPAMYNAFCYGAPPHAGIAPGVDRMVMLLAGEDSIREIIPFPMNKTAQDVMMGAPYTVSWTFRRRKKHKGALAMTFAYPAIIHPTEKGYTATFPDLTDCAAEGDTLNECLDNAYHAMYNWLYVELTEFEGHLPPISHKEDLILQEGDFVRNISAIMRLTDGWDE